MKINGSIERRVNSLLKRMTLEERVHQLCAIRAQDVLEDGRFSPAKARRTIGRGIGHATDILRNLGPGDGAELANELQRFAMEQTRLGIPVLISDEACHGCMAKGSASFPQSIGMASTWDPELVRRAAAATGLETASRGIRRVNSPSVNIARDVRCGRTDETYGEDPFLTAAFAVAFVKGLQSEGVAATPKHFVANYVGDGGRDSNAIHLSERILREIYFPAFEAAVRAGGALSVMPAYNSLDGEPCTCNHWLLTDVLREEWGFRGIVVADYEAVEKLHTFHRVAGSKGEAAAKAVAAGMDVELPRLDYYKELVRAVRAGKLSEAIVDTSVRRVLRVKMELDLFENPYVKTRRAVEICDNNAHRQLALEAARESIVLLKNDGILPLKKTLNSIAIIGPNADPAEVHLNRGYDPVFGAEAPHGYNPLLGGYSPSGTRVVTPLEGIRAKVSPGTEVRSAQGCQLVEAEADCDFMDAIKLRRDGEDEAVSTWNERDGFDAAIKAAAGADAAVLFMGNWSLFWPMGSEGEGSDRCNLDLPGMQEELIREVCLVNRRVVVVLIGGSAVTMGKWLDDVPAVVEAWFPGEEGGTAVADVLFGDHNPSGKLPITFPVTTGQLPLYYNPKPTGRSFGYRLLPGQFLPRQQTQFPFGHGLSYTRFRYSHLRIKKMRKAGRLQVRVRIDIGNTGRRKGVEIVQLYLHDTVSRLSRPIKELKGFQKMSLARGETRTAEFLLSHKDFAYLGPNLKPVVEPGGFEIMLGSSSEDIRAEGSVVI